MILDNRKKAWFSWNSKIISPTHIFIICHQLKMILTSGQQGILSFNVFNITAPDVKILMEDNSFLISAPCGDINPSVAGTPAPRLVAGKVGSALRLEGAELNYGKPNECFYDINPCTNGLSVSLWVKYYSLNPDSDGAGGAPEGEGVILDGGGFYLESQGLHLSRNGYLNFHVSIFDKSRGPLQLYTLWGRLCLETPGVYLERKIFPDHSLPKWMLRQRKFIRTALLSTTYGITSFQNRRKCIWRGCTKRRYSLRSCAYVVPFVDTRRGLAALYTRWSSVREIEGGIYWEVTTRMWLYIKRISAWDLDSRWSWWNSIIDRPQKNTSMVLTCALLVLVYPWG